MKKALIMILACILLFTLTACAGSGSGEKPESSPQPGQTDELSIVEPSSPANAPETSAPEASAPAISAQEASAPETSEPASNVSKVLVAYFSCTGNTEAVAGTIAEATDADLYEIIPETPYTDADLNYNDKDSRTSVEMNDGDSRPAISGSVENMDAYDVIYLGYPIWWGEAPHIIRTFLESYDLSGKTIVPFCTSGGSGVGMSAANLNTFASGAEWLDGHKFNSNVSEDTVKEWISGLGLALTAD